MLRQSLRAVVRLPVRGLAPKKGKKGAADAGGSKVSGVMSTTEATGCNIYKNGTDPPILPDDQYPDWLWKLSEPAATLNELRRMDVDTLNMDDLKRLVKLQRRAAIRASNVERAKK